MSESFYWLLHSIFLLRRNFCQSLSDNGSLMYKSDSYSLRIVSNTFAVQLMLQIQSCTVFYNFLNLYLGYYGNQTVDTRFSEVCKARPLQCCVWLWG